MDEGYAPHRPVIAPSIAAIARGALSTVTESKLAAVVTAEPVAAAQIVATSKVDDDQTINTKLALEDIEKMFNSDDFGFVSFSSQSTFIYQLKHLSLFDSRLPLCLIMNEEIARKRRRKTTLYVSFARIYHSFTY